MSLLTGCSSTRHVPDGKYLLDRATITVDGDRENVKPDQLANYLRQTPNHKILGFAKLQLATYNLSGQDSTKWYNRWVRKIGQPPVIYDAELTNQSVRQLRQALINKGYN
ncbi:MAG: outer membrane protein assembly factor, partial [Muribaculaceae bacterium]|nr:outer membrane protein assembly factor [Muribaculaceae bacterium]